MRTGLVCLTLASLAVAPVVPAVAQAYRAATPTELSEMERSAALYHENPHDYGPGLTSALIYFWRVYLHLPAKHPENQTRCRPGDGEPETRLR